MKDLKNYIESGIIEAYVMGLTSATETLEVEAIAEANDAVKDAIDQYSSELETFAINNAVTPDPIVKPMVMASFDYMKRLSAGEIPSFPPVLTVQSTIQNYNQWLLRDDMILNKDTDGIYAKIIGHSPTVMTAIVWLKDYAPQEVHHDEYERFLILEGSCDITIDNHVHTLTPGHFLEIPLHKNHIVKVTSMVPCKVLLQRVAA